MCFLFETKLFPIFVRRSHHSQFEDQVFALNDRDVKYQHLAPYESKKLDYTKVDFFQPDRPSRELSDSEQETFSIQIYFSTVQIDFVRFSFRHSYREISTCSHSLNFDFNMFLVEVFRTA